MRPSRIPLSRWIQSIAHSVGLTGDYGEVSARGLIGLDPALLPIAQRPDRNVIACRKIFLAETKCAPDDPRLRGALHASEVFFGEGSRVGIVERRLMALRFGHGVEATPIDLG